MNHIQLSELIKLENYNEFFDSILYKYKIEKKLLPKSFMIIKS